MIQSIKEKESIVLESCREGRNKTANKYDINRRLLQRWRSKYRDHSIDGLESKTGKTKGRGTGNHPSFEGDKNRAFTLG